jgi:hypothetical protein
VIGTGFSPASIIFGSSALAIGTDFSPSIELTGSIESSTKNARMGQLRGFGYKERQAGCWYDRHCFEGLIPSHFLHSLGRKKEVIIDHCWPKILTIDTKFMIDPMFTIMLVLMVPLTKLSHVMTKLYHFISTGSQIFTLKIHRVCIDGGWP